MLFLIALSYLFLGACGAVCWVLLFPKKTRSPDKPSKELARTPARCYDNALRLLSEEQGEWYVNVILERELSNLYKFYSRHEIESTAGRSSGRRFDDEIDAEESEESGSESESADSSSDEESETEEYPRATSRQSRAAPSKTKPSSGRNDSSELATAPSMAKAAPAKEEYVCGARSRAGGRKKQTPRRSRPMQAAPALTSAPQAPASEAVATGSPLTTPPVATKAAPVAAPTAASEPPTKPSAPIAPPRPIDWQKYVAASLAEDAWIQAAEDHTRATGKILEVLPQPQRA